MQTALAASVLALGMGGDRARAKEGNSATASISYELLYNKTPELCSTFSRLLNDPALQQHQLEETGTPGRWHIETIPPDLPELELPQWSEVTYEGNERLLLEIMSGRRKKLHVEPTPLRDARIVTHVEGAHTAQALRIRRTELKYDETRQPATLYWIWQDPWCDKSHCEYAGTLRWALIEGNDDDWRELWESSTGNALVYFSKQAYVVGWQAIRDWKTDPPLGELSQVEVEFAPDDRAISYVVVEGPSMHRWRNTAGFDLAECIFLGRTFGRDAF